MAVSSGRLHEEGGKPRPRAKGKGKALDRQQGVREKGGGQINPNGEESEKHTGQPKKGSREGKVEKKHAREFRTRVTSRIGRRFLVEKRPQSKKKLGHGAAGRGQAVGKRKGGVTLKTHQWCAGQASEKSRGRGVE